MFDDSGKNPKNTRWWRGATRKRRPPVQRAGLLHGSAAAGHPRRHARHPDGGLHASGARLAVIRRGARAALAIDASTKRALRIHVRLAGHASRRGGLRGRLGTAGIRATRLAAVRARRLAAVRVARRVLLLRILLLRILLLRVLALGVLCVFLLVFLPAT